MASQRRVVDHIIDKLVSVGVEHLFGVDGANIEDLYDAAYFSDGITAVLAKHEFSAAAMADGYARGTGRLGVVMATSGGGSLNLVPGLGESFASRVPLLALVGQPPASSDGRGSFQDTSGENGSLNAVNLFSAVSVYCRRVLKADDIFTALAEAIAAALRGGPAVLLLPKDIQQQVIGTSCVPAVADADFTAHPVAEGALSARLIAHMLRRARGPVTIIAGEQVARDDARAELEQLRSVLRARVATVPDAKDVSGSPGLGASSGLGVTGVMGHPTVVDEVRNSAICLLVGTRMPMTSRAGLDDALAAVPTISIGSAAPYPLCTHIQSANLRISLSRLAADLSGRGRPAGVRVPEFIPRAELQPPAYNGPGVRYRDVIAALDTALPAGADIVVDAGNTGAAAIHQLPVRRSGRFVVALGMGGMGYSFGAGIGMAFGRGGRTVVVAGDGAFFMHGMEIHTALQYRLPITFVLLNNNAHAMCVTREQLYYGGGYSYNRFDPSELGAGLAAMFPGLPAVDVKHAGQLTGALDDALSVDGPSVVSVECSAEEIPPFAPFLTTTSLKKTEPQNVRIAEPKDHKEEYTDVAARA